MGVERWRGRLTAPKDTLPFLAFDNRGRVHRLFVRKVQHGNSSASDEGILLLFFPACLSHRVAHAA